MTFLSWQNFFLAGGLSISMITYLCAGLLSVIESTDLYNLIIYDVYRTCLHNRALDSVQDLQDLLPIILPRRPW